MHDHVTTEGLYTIGHLTLFTGLTDRTIRNYLASGLLEGEKINGVWHFTPEQMEAFVRHPAVRPSILAKKHAKVYDFLLDTKKTAARACVILDLPGDDQERLSAFFCRTITEEDFHDIQFSFDAVGDYPRVILTGDSGEVLRLVGEYHRTC